VSPGRRDARLAAGRVGTADARPDGAPQLRPVPAVRSRAVAAPVAAVACSPPAGADVRLAGDEGRADRSGCGAGIPATENQGSFARVTIRVESGRRDCGAAR